MISAVIKMISKTKLFNRALKKGNQELVETIVACKSNEAWLNIGKIISSSRKQMPAVNLDRIEKESKEGEVVVVPGKVLSNGEMTKKIKIAALKFSETAREKLSRHKSEMITILEEIKKNPKAQDIKLIR
ncbi:MAG: 50S ribosomal protein L18e [Nanoarchaeota archaeon]